MNTLAILEHLQKIPYLLSLFVPVALFFFAGLALAWWIWHKDARRLQSALSENDRITNGLSAAYQKKHDLGSRFSGLFEKRQKHWESELSDRDGKIADLKNYREKCSELESERNGLKSKIDERESKLGELEGDLSKNVTALGLLQSQVDDGKGETDKLRSQVKELDALRGKLADLEKGSAEKEKQVVDLKAKLAAQGEDSGELASLRDQLAKAQQDLEATRASDSKSVGTMNFSAESGARKDDQLGYLYSSRPAKVDDLTKISGVGSVLEPKLNDFGVYQYKQVALWSQDNIDAFSEKLDFKGRVEREQWVNQAADLHRQEHGEHLAPVVNIYHKVQTTPAPAKPSSFENEPVKVDPQYGVLYTERPSKIDDLKRISGVAGVLEGKLHEIGLYRFKQIAMWTDQQAADFSDKLAFPGRVERDEWVKQAAALHAEKYGDS